MVRLLMTVTTSSLAALFLRSSAAAASSTASSASSSFSTVHRRFLFRHPSFLSIHQQQRRALFVSGGNLYSHTNSTNNNNGSLASTIQGTTRAFSSNGNNNTMTSSLPSTLQGAPVSAYIAPGNCQFTDKPVPCRLVSRTTVSNTSSVLRFALPDAGLPLNLPTCACILAKSMIKLKKEDGEEEEETAVVRPYTPISTNKNVGYFDLLVKNYGEQGVMSRHLHEIEVGSEEISFFHIPKNVKLQSPDFMKQYKQILMLIGGTGVTPMIQALHEILGCPTDVEKPVVTILYGSRQSDDILGQELLNEWAKQDPEHLKVHYVLSHEPEDSAWTGLRGFINKDVIAEYFPYNPKEENANEEVAKTVSVWICGPPPMYKALCGPREECEVAADSVLGQMGFDSKQVYKY